MSTIHDVYYNSHDLACRSPFGAVTPGTAITFQVDTKDLSNVTCYLNYYQEKPTPKVIKTLTMDQQGGIHSATLQVMERGLFFYWFSVSVEGRTTYFGNSHDSLGGLAVPYDQEYQMRMFQITVHEYSQPAPAWYKNAIFYQIFPDRFHNGNADGHINHPKPGSFLYAHWEDTPYYIKNPKGAIERWEFSGGNLLGIRKKLDYLTKLGITGIYLNPIFEARSNHRYDTGDYHKIDPMLGTNEEFSDLMASCQERNIGVILDGVFNHTGADSLYFNARGTYPTMGAHQSLDSPYSEWYTFRQFPDNYECWWGVTDLPNVNETKGSYQQFIMNPETGVIPYWIKRGALGWRLDVADELPDYFIQGIRAVMKKTDEANQTVLIGEVWEDASNKISYSQRRSYLLGQELHGVMNYPFKDAIIRYLSGQARAEEIYRVLMSIKENYPKEALYANLNSLGTHDTRRIRTELNDNRLLRLAVVMLMSLPGVPCIYYGDEAGLYGERDPYNRATYPWGNEDETVMAIYEEAIALRQSAQAFTGGEFFPFFQGEVFGYIRVDEESLHLLAFNPGEGPQPFSLNHPVLERKEPITATISAGDFVHLNFVR
ncbi:MAG: glycoside hydrolase family 13 protein [Clostridiaceae bacterium]